MIKPFNKEFWQGRVDLEDGISGKRWHQLIKEFPKTHQAYLDKSVVFLGFSSDEGVRRNKGRVGAAKAPNLIRKSLSPLPHMESEVSALYDYGNIICVGRNLEEARSEQIQVLKNLIRKKAYPLVLGGGHEVAYGNFLALADSYKKVGIINIDAHFDLRLPNPDSSSGTGFYEMSVWSEQNQKEFHYMCLGVQQIANTKAIFDRADQLKAQYVLADEIHEGNRAWSILLDSFIRKVDAVYLSLDMDCFDVSYAPGVSAPSTNGLTPYQVKMILKHILKSKKVKLMDVAEYNPEYDIDNRTAKLAAYMISEMVHNL